MTKLFRHLTVLLNVLPSSPLQQSQRKHTTMKLFQDGFEFERPTKPRVAATTIKAPEKEAAQRIANVAFPIHGTATNQEYDPLLKAIGNVGTVLIGESTHGTHEFYETRANMTMRLIREGGVRVLCIEGDFPAVARVNRYLLGVSGRAGEEVAKNADDALSLFRDDFPVWMWRNTVMKDFVESLKKYNEEHPQDPVHLYGLDMQGHIEHAVHGVESFVEKHGNRDQKQALATHMDPIKAYAGEGGGHDYSMQLMMRGRQPLTGAAQALYELVKTMSIGEEHDLESFEAQRMAAHIVSWEHYNRAAIEDRGGRTTWNIRDTHFFETLLEAKHFHKDARAVCWAHNSHMGDARATELGRVEHNLGQLVRENFGNDNSYIVGFSTFADDVTSAKRWGGDTLRQRVSAALPYSYGALMHEVATTMEDDDGSLEGFYVIMHSKSNTAKLPPEVKGVIEELTPPRLQRAIGVQYRKNTERQSHYFSACLPLQFDTLIHVDQTRALEPLEGWSTYS